MKLKLKKNSEKRLNYGHLWVFSNELEEIPKYEAGSVVEVIDYYGNSFGFGFYNPNSLISIRLLMTDKMPDLEFYKIRIQNALNLRLRVYANENSYRLIFGESDSLSGLIIDKYEDYFSFQYLSAGIEKQKDLILKSILELFPNTKGIIEKNNSQLRKYEGLELIENIIFGSIPDLIEISENNIKYNISLKEGQKTGYYLDQKENRLLIKKFVKDLSILDCFTNQGSFAFNAALAGAKNVFGIDSSNDAIEKAKINALVNGFQNIQFESHEVMEFLQNTQDKWDMIILDPPAFAKSKKAVPTALKGYAKLNRLAMNKLNKGGFLVSSSCSGLITEDVFLNLITYEAAKLNKNIKLLFRGTQAADHPIYLPMPETKYLKFFIFQVD